MALDCTERWTERTWSEQYQGTKLVYSGNIGFDVINSPTEADALAKLPFVIGTSHDVQGDKATCVARIPEKKGFNFWRVTCLFSSEGGGGDLRTLPPEYSWGITLVSEEVDRDARGNAITNSAGDPVVNKPYSSTRILTLYWEQWEAAYDPRRAMQFVDKVNEDSFRVLAGNSFNGSGFGGDGFTVEAGECLCADYRPVSRQTVDQTPIKCAYEFQFQERIDLNPTSGGEAPEGGRYLSRFDWRNLDEGNRGWGYNGNSDTGVRDAFYNSKGSEMLGGVLLDGHGVPLDTDLHVGRSTANGQPKSMPKPKGCIVDKRFKPDAVFLCWQRHETKNFKGLISYFK